jgi:hypothetical protein
MPAHSFQPSRSFWLLVTAALTFTVSACQPLESTNAPVAAQPIPPDPAPAAVLPPFDPRLRESVRLANQSRFADAIAQLDTIDEGDAATVQGIVLREAWSLQMLDRALEKYNQADLKGAIEIARTIPAQTEGGREAQQQLPIWQRQSGIVNEALALIQTNPQRALERFSVLEDAPFAQSNRFQKWLAQAEDRIRWQERYRSY